MRKLAIWPLIIFLIAICCAVVAHAFTLSLNFVTRSFYENHWLIWMLPIAGLISTFVYQRFGVRSSQGIGLAIAEYQNPKLRIEKRMSVLVIFTTLLTHLTGGSVGREGVAIQFGAVIGDNFSHLFKFSSENRRIFILAGMAAGFGALFGTPIAASIFALEIIPHTSRKYHLKLFLIPLMALLAYWTTGVLNTPHTTYPKIEGIEIVSIFKFIVIGLSCALTSVIFIKIVKSVRQAGQKLLYKNPYYLSYGAGIFVAIFISQTHLFQLTGLGMPTIIESFSTPSVSYLFMLKLLITAILIGAGFKGGEVTPLFFIGATLGSFLATPLGLPIEQAAAIGLICVFATATNAPFACAVMGAELFGIEIFPYAIVIAFLSNFIKGKRSIYFA